LIEGKVAVLIKDAANLMQAKVSSSDLIEKEITGFGFDSRVIKEGELFFAISAEDYAQHSFTDSSFQDAQRYIPNAFNNGAIAAVAHEERVLNDEALRGFKDRILFVDDVIAALQRLANGVLVKWNRPVIAITGSAGKTTAKDLTAHILSSNGRRVLKTQKNHNNELGVPLSILQMESGGQSPAQFDVAVLEMGMSMGGELTRLTKIAPPDIAVELCVAPVHLEFFGTIERIADAKAELVGGLKPEGTAILNADDRLVAAMREKHPGNLTGKQGKVLTFGIESKADITATNIESVELGLTKFRLNTPLGQADVELPMLGIHNLMNALAASSVAVSLGIEPEGIANALKVAVPSEMRGQVLDFAYGFRVIDDSYNSNPRALLSMVQTIATGGAYQRRIVIAGEMLELGPDGPKLHHETGREIAQAGVDVLWGVRGLAQDLIEGACEAGMARDHTRFFTSSDEAANAILSEIREGDLVLVKGSRGVQTDKVVKRLREKYTLKG
jgi:UDP-N-acetylmuramoyl-tripeptide--D-alanyl-D-alanine ligase